MTWRNWSVLIVLILMNYLVFSLLGSFIFVPGADTTPTPTHAPQPTFTPGARALTQVPSLPYTFLTPSAIPGSPRAAATATSATLAAPTPTATRAP